MEKNSSKESSRRHLGGNSTGDQSLFPLTSPSNHFLEREEDSTREKISDQDGDGRRSVSPSSSQLLISNWNKKSKVPTTASSSLSKTSPVFHSCLQNQPSELQSHPVSPAQKVYRLPKVKASYFSKYDLKKVKNSSDKLLSRSNTRKLKDLTKIWRNQADVNQDSRDQIKSERFRINSSDSEDWDKEESLFGKYLGPVPDKWAKPKSIFAYYWFFTRERKRLVRFPDEVVKKAELDQRYGETMGKAREVKRSRKHRQRLSALLYPEKNEQEHVTPDLKSYHVLSSELPFPPDWECWAVGNDPDTTCNCFRQLFCKKKKKQSFTPSEEKLEPPSVYSDKFKATEQRLCKSLDVIEDYTVGNLKTVNYTLGVIGFLPLETPLDAEDSRISLKEDGFNHIAAGVWFFTFSIEELFQKSTDTPTRAEFDELMVEFMSLAVLSERVARRTVIYSQLHSVFAATAMSRLMSATDRLHIRSRIMDGFETKPPALLGHCLNISNESSKPKFYKIVARAQLNPPKPTKENPWLNFSSMSKAFKLEYLREFLTKLQHRIITLNIQMRFLTDDIFEQNRESLSRRRRKGWKAPRKQRFLSAINSLDVVVYRFSVFKETTPKYEKALKQTLEAVADDIYELLTKGEKIIEAIVEVRDMVELAIIYMVEVYGIEFDRIISRDYQFNFHKSNWRQRCCKKLGSICSDDLVAPSPGFKSSDFFNTVFPDFLQKQAMIYSETGHEFILTQAREEDRKRCRIVFPDQGKGFPTMKIPSNSSSTNLDPPVGDGGVWDDLSSKMDLSELKNKVIVSSHDSSDIRSELSQ